MSKYLFYHICFISLGWQKWQTKRDIHNKNLIFSNLCNYTNGNNIYIIQNVLNIFWLMIIIQTSIK